MSNIPSPHLLTLRQIAQQGTFDLTPYGESRFILGWVEDLLAEGLVEPLSDNGRPAVRITAAGLAELSELAAVEVVSTIGVRMLLARHGNGVVPTISLLAPLSAAAGSQVVITGTNFLGATMVSINSGAVASFNVDSATQITAVLTNSQASGRVRVHTPAGVGVSAVDFTVSTGAGSYTGNPNEHAIYALLGQSNAHGVGFNSEIAGTALAAVTPALAREYQRVDTFSFFPPYPALHLGVTNDGNTGTFGPEMGLAQAHEEHRTGTATLVKVAQDGQPLNVFSKGSSNYQTFVDRIAAAKTMATNAGKTPRVYIVVAHGEANAGDTTYQAQLQQLYNDLLADGATAADTPWAVWEVMDNAVVQGQQAGFAAANPATVRLIQTDAYQRNPDGIHYNARTQFLGGYTDTYNALYGTSYAYPFSMVPSPAETPVIASIVTPTTPGTAAVGDEITVFALFASSTAVLNFGGVSAPVPFTSVGFQAGFVVTVPPGATGGVSITANGKTSAVAALSIAGVVAPPDANIMHWIQSADNVVTDEGRHVAKVDGAGNSFGAGSAVTREVFHIDSTMDSSVEQARITFPSGLANYIFGTTQPSSAHTTFTTIEYGAWHNIPFNEILHGQVGADTLAAMTDDMAWAYFSNRVELYVGAASTPVFTHNETPPAALQGYFCPANDGTPAPNPAATLFNVTLTALDITMV